jgi:hypothetical protein
MLYELKMEFRKLGWSTDKGFVYDVEHDLFRFPDGEFAFSRLTSGGCVRKVLADRGGPIPLTTGPEVAL